MSTRRWLAGVASALLLVSLVLVLRSRGRSPDAAPAPAGRPGGAATHLAGTASCSARGCHGGIEPAGGAGARQDEYTAWLAHDKHARAYEVLKEPRAGLMARNLAVTNPGGKEIPAHEDLRCLACHTIPLAADSKEKELQQDGVGCEACHGPARGDKPWLEAHTTAAWKALTPEKKAGYGMTPLEDPAAQAHTCAGCHVGAPADAKGGLPPRDLNHDLMAAGHPRLTFELASFRANMPPHWRVDKHDKTEPGYEARVWAVGQVVSAGASLELLVSRADAASAALEHNSAHPPEPVAVRWPEFAEYARFACHADLRAPSWRQADYFGRRKPGALPYNTWFSALLPVLEPPGDALAGTFADLGLTMSRPGADPEKVATQARKGIAELQALREKVNASRYDRAAVKALLGKLAGRSGRVAVMSWDEVEQLTLAVAALAQADRTLARAEKEKPLLGKEADRDLRALFGALAFPPGSESPGGFGSEVKPHERLKELLDQLPRP